MGGFGGGGEKGMGVGWKMRERGVWFGGGGGREGDGGRLENEGDGGVVWRGGGERRGWG